MIKLKIGDLIYDCLSFSRRIVLFQKWNPKYFIDFEIKKNQNINEEDIQEELNKNKNIISIITENKTIQEDVEQDLYFHYDANLSFLSFNFLPKGDIKEWAEE